VTVFAAASLTDALKAVAARYQQHSPDSIVFNFAASGTLALQVQRGAPADLFFSADESRMDDLEKRGLLARGTRRDVLGNTLVIVAAADAPPIHSLKDLAGAGVERVAIGDPGVVPAGTYAVRCLQTAGIWPAVEPKVVRCENVRAVLAAVESGNVTAGLVYRTDARLSRKVVVAGEIPAADAPAIRYPVALLAEAPQPDAARKFLDYLGSGEAAAVFREFGFEVVHPPAGP
jgi:molybdate transport system substrate-binding protein